MISYNVLYLTAKKAINTMSKNKLLENIVLCNIENKDTIEKEVYPGTFIEKRLSLLPQKLYKFREGNDNDLNALKDNYVWFSQPKECDDLMDSTLNFDIKKQAKRLENYFEENIDQFILNMLTKAHSKLAKKLDIEKIKYLRENCFDSDGKILLGKSISFLGYKFTTNDLSSLEKVIKNFSKAFDKDHLSKLINTTFNLINEANITLRERMMVYCLCEDYKNQALWSKYANNNKGFCIEYKFDKSNEFSNDIKKYIFNLFPIVYGKKKQFNILVFFEKAIDNLMFRKSNSDIPLEDTLELNKQLLTKDSSWKWQKEWRIVLKYEDKNNRQPAPFISKIIIGSQAPKKLINDLKEICKGKIPLFQQILNDSGSDYIYRKITNHKT